MADNRVKRKAWMHCKDAKIPRTTAWRSKTVGKRNVRKSLMSDSLVKKSIVAEESVRSSSSVSDESTFTFANETGFQSDHSSTAGLQIISRLAPVKLSGQTYFCSDISHFGPDKHR